MEQNHQARREELERFGAGEFIEQQINQREQEGPTRLQQDTWTKTCACLSVIQPHCCPASTGLQSMNNLMRRADGKPKPKVPPRERLKKLLKQSSTIIEARPGSNAVMCISSVDCLGWTHGLKPGVI